MADYICAQPLIQSDETPVRMQLADGQMETARLFAYGLPWRRSSLIFAPTRVRKDPRSFFKDRALAFYKPMGQFVCAGV